MQNDILYNLKKATFYSEKLPNLEIPPFNLVILSAEKLRALKY